MKYPPSWTPTDCDALETLFAKATAERLWFFHGGLSGPLWFTPAELRSEHENGKFIWGAPNWQLQSPQVRIDQIDAAIKTLLAERQEVERKWIGL